MTNGQAGKGDTYRPVDREAYEKNYERAFTTSLVNVLVPTGMAGPIQCVIAERERQMRKWGEQNHPHLCPVLTTRPGGASPQRFADDLGIPSAAMAKAYCARECANGNGNWGLILTEEHCEMIEAAALGDLKALREELSHVAAVAVAWIEQINKELA